MRRFSTTQPDFEQRLAELLAFESAQDPQVDTTVAAILADVKPAATPQCSNTPRGLTA